MTITMQQSSHTEYVGIFFKSHLKPNCIEQSYQTQDIGLLISTFYWLLSVPSVHKLRYPAHRKPNSRIIIHHVNRIREREQMCYVQLSSENSLLVWKYKYQKHLVDGYILKKKRKKIESKSDQKCKTGSQKSLAVTYPQHQTPDKMW